jgi:hypothetical protein
MTMRPGVTRTHALVLSVVALSSSLSGLLDAAPAAAADPQPVEVVRIPPDPLPPRFAAVGRGQPLYGANLPWDSYGTDFGSNLWGYRGLANQGPAGWRRETRGQDGGTKRLFWAQRDATDYCLGAQIGIAGAAPGSESSALLFWRFDEAAAQPTGTFLNLTNQTITARVYLPAASAGPASARSGVMLFFQDANWNWAQTPWMNITSTDSWITVTAHANDFTFFDRSRVRTVGIKIGANSYAFGFSYIGPVFIDEVIVSVSPDIRFDFSQPDTRTEQELKDFAGLQIADRPGLKIYTLRWWLVADGRAGLTFDSNGLVTGLDDEFLADLRELLRLAKSARVYLMPVLLDFLLGAEPLPVDGVLTFGRAGLINDSVKRQSFFDHALGPIFEELADSSEVLAIDLINEPEWLLMDHPEITMPPGKRPPEIKPGGVVTLDTMRSFLAAVIDLHKQKRQPGKHPLLTVGSASQRWVGLWTSLGLDMAQFHLWNGPGQIDEGLAVPLPPPVAGVPNVLGEFTTLAGVPLSRCDMYKSGFTHGYAGAFPWAYRAKDTASLPLLGAETRACLASLPRFTFTDEPVVSGATAIRAAHVNELRVSVDTLRASCGLEPYPYAAPAPAAGVSTIQAAHFSEPRTALDQYFDCRALPRPSYPFPQPAPGTPVLGRHLSEIRAAASGVP